MMSMTESKKKIALICGISGQDGSYLAQFLLNKNYVVWGSSRNAKGSSFANLRRFSILDKVMLLSMVPEDIHSVFMAINKIEPE